MALCHESTVTKARGQIKLTFLDLESQDNFLLSSLSAFNVYTLSRQFLIQLLSDTLVYTQTTSSPLALF